MGGGMGAGQGFPAKQLQALFSAGGTTVGTACLRTGSGAARLSRNLTPPHQGSPVPKQPLPRLVLKTWKVWGLEDMQKTNSVKPIILLLKMKKIEEINTNDSKGGACVLSQPLPDSACAYTSDQKAGAPTPYHRRE